MSLLNNLYMKSIILASKSPRRKELLEKIGLKFKAVKSNYKEIIDSKLNPHELSEKLSLEKAKAVYWKNPPARGKNSIIIAADTLVVCDGKILGKPKGQKDAKKMLSFLSNKAHLVITGFTIINGNLKKIITKSIETKVFMRKISVSEIDTYIKTKEPFDKAGAYAIQGKAKKFIKTIDGDLLNAIGLPLNSLMKELKKLGVK